MKISGTDDSGWMPIDLTEVAEAITVLQRLASAVPDDAVAAGGDGRGSLRAQAHPPVSESLPGA